MDSFTANYPNYYVEYEAKARYNIVKLHSSSFNRQSGEAGKACLGYLADNQGPYLQHGSLVELTGKGFFNAK